ncbi:MAG: 16S rRNA processing protein RimM [Muribaculaceae bacterium]|nr:16S rRNA processing protein RimM [Muribaculaceae bacterium]
MITREELINIGHYNKPHGINGEISATVEVDFDVLQDLTCLVSDIDGIFVPFFVTAMRSKTAETVLLTIDGMTSEQDVQRLVNHDIYALKREFRQESEDAEADGYPLDFFIGFDLDDDQGNRVGQIVDVNEQTENAFFIVQRTDGAELLIPAVDDLIVEFDLDKKVMVMSLPDGLLDLNVKD